MVCFLYFGRSGKCLNLRRFFCTSAFYVHKCRRRLMYRWKYWPTKFFFLGRHELTYFKITLPKCWFTENYYRSIFFFQQGFILKIKICYIFVLFLRVVCYWLKTSRPLDSLYLENLQYVNNGTFYWFLICLWSLGWNYCMAQPNIGYWKFFILCTFFSSGNILCIHMII